MRLLLTANSPGEMAGWVRPLVQAWRDSGEGPVDLLLLPCTFATGQEERVARSLPGVERVYRPRDYAGLLWRHGQRYRQGALLHLGGDLMYSALLSWRWGLSAWSYLWARPWWNSAFAGTFTKDPRGIDWLLRRRVPPEKIHEVGDLVLDALRQSLPAAPSPETPRDWQVSYLPGSRAIEVRTLAPLFLEVHRQLQSRFPGLRGVLHLSPYLPQGQVSEVLQAPPDPQVGGVQGTLQERTLSAGTTELELAGEDGLHRLAASRLAISIPGTKTAEAGYLRTPVLTILPLNRPEHLPSIGLLGLLDFVPGGRHLKGRLLLRLRDRVGLLAHPNILAGRALLPELVDVLDGRKLAETAAETLANPNALQQVQRDLATLYPWDRYPAQQIVARIRASLPARQATNAF